MHRLDLGVIATKQHGRDEGTALGVGSDDLDGMGVTEDGGRAGGELGHLAAHVLALVEPDESAHGDALGCGGADHDLGQLRADRVGHLVETLARDEGATDRSALLPRLDGHLRDQRVDEEDELRGARTGVGSEDRAVQGVGFRVEAD